MPMGEPLLTLGEEDCLQFYADFVTFMKLVLESLGTVSQTISR